MKRRLPAGLDLFSGAAFGLVALAAICVIGVALDDYSVSSRTATAATPSVDDQPAVSTTPGKTLVRFASSDGVYLVTVRGGVVTVESGMNVLSVGAPGDPDDPPPDDPPADLAKAFADAIAKVTSPDKVQTAANLKAVVDGALVPAINGKLTDINDVKANLPMVLILMTMTKPDWGDFSTLIKASIVKVTTIAELVSVLQPASDELGKVK